MPFVRFAEIWPFGVLAFGNEFFVFGTFTFVIQHFHAVKPMFYMGTVGDNSSGIPFADSVYRFVGIGLYQVIKRGHGTASVMVAQFGIGVALVVQNLIFKTNRGAFALVHVGIHKIFDTAVGAFGEFEVGGQLKISEQVFGHDIAPGRGFFAAR